MRVRAPAVVALLFAVAAWAAWQRIFPSDEAQIRAALNRVAAAMTDTVEEKPLSALTRAAALSEEFARDVSVDAGSPFSRIEGREALLATAARLRGMVPELDVRFVDVDVNVDEARTEARVTTTAEARFLRAGGDAREVDARELDIGLGRRDGRWVITSVRLVDVLEP